MSEAQEIQMGEDEKWEEALKSLNDKAKERKWNRDTKINQRFYPNDKQVRYLNVMGCAPEDYIYGFDTRQGCSRLIDEYERKIRRFRKFHRNEDVTSGLAVVIAEKLSSKIVRKRNELPKKNEIQRIYTTKTNEGIAMQIDPNHAEVIFDYNPFKDAMELLEIALKGKLILKKFHVHVYVVELALRRKQIPVEAKLLEAQPEMLCQDRDGEGPANPGMEERMLRNPSKLTSTKTLQRKASKKSLFSYLSGDHQQELIVEMELHPVGSYGKSMMKTAQTPPFPTAEPTLVKMVSAWTFKGTKKSNRKRLKDTLTTIPPINDVEEGIALKNAQLRFKEENTKHLLELLYQMNHVRWKLRICKEKTNRNQKRQILPSSMKEDTSVVNEDCLKSRALATDGDETPHEETHREDSIAYTANVSVGQALSSMETQQITNIKQLQHMEISSAIKITGIDESASTLMFAGYTLNSYGLKRGIVHGGNRLRVDMTDFGGTETITVWMFHEVAKKRAQEFTRGKWLKLYGFEVIPTVPKYDRGTWGFTLKIMDTTIVEEFQHSPPLLRLSVPTISIAEFTNMHRGRDSIGSIEAVMIKVNSLAHNTAEITVADNGDSSDTLTVIE
ncbi:hypothetical protein SELMODRAFT_430318 [Selaginella moellendorffii]|uniref:Uncharacterized protein n=1 Tax=Selaginella moellendorffii TaxID=88036 RepID=D8T909_SELML|nr:hypothetical protein SELMODRAFT_430318 [Selaginella moellendorffii]